MKHLFIFLIGILSLQAKAEPIPRIDHVVIVVLENENYNEAMAQPFFQELAKKGALLNNHFALARPSQPNYIALTAGDLYGVVSNGAYNLAAKNIVDLLEEKGKTWKSYNEGYPGNCFAGGSYGNYVRKHNPFISFNNIRNNPARCANIVDGNQFQIDYKKGALPNFSFYTPDLLNDGHDTSVEFAAKATEATFGALLKDEEIMKSTLFILTFDEAQKFSGSKIYTSLNGAMVVPGTVLNKETNHYSMLKLIEDIFGLNDLGRKDKTAEPITGIWR